MRRMCSVGAVVLSLMLTLGGCGIAPVPVEEKGADVEVTTPEVTTETEATTSEKRDVAPAPSGAGEQMVEAEEVGLDLASNMAFDVPNYNTEEYAQVNEGGFVSCVASPLSTVSADVDTASYANLRRMLTAGYRTKSAAAKDDDSVLSGMDDTEREQMQMIYGPSYEDVLLEERKVIPAGAVRIEEMLNYFDYDYPAAPAANDLFEVSAKLSECPWNADTELLVLGFATAAEDAAVAEAGSNLVFLIDVSGSMDDPDKLPLLQSSFADLVETLDAKDRVSIVTYSGEEQVVIEGVAGSEQREIMRAIRSLEASGMTNGESGLKMAYEVAERNRIEGGVNRIIMASDGDLNLGMTSESDLHDFVDAKRKTGIYLSVLGFGAGNYKDNKMETLADNGNGQYHYIDCEREARRVFGANLTANLVPLADDTKVQVEFNPAQVKGYRLIGYENRTMAAEDFTDDAKDAGEVGPSSQFTVVYEIVPHDSSVEVTMPELKYGSDQSVSAHADEWLTVSVRYRVAGTEEVRQQEKVVRSGDWVNDAGDDWRFSAAVCEFGMLLRDSPYKGTSSYDAVRALVGDTTDELRQEFLELVKLAETN